ncbi:MAG: ABC transporter permease [Candidatus Bipolaricaulota bacterium]|nr:ABC transporter permease [Candidatus Bipolaricaulota bacterium]
MFSFIVRRILWTIPVILIVSSITFLLMHSVPGSPFTRERALPAAIQKNLEAKYHLDDPLWKQYIDYMYGFLRLDFGPSIAYRSRTVNDILAQQWPVTATLGGVAFLFAVVMGIPLGVLSAVKQNTLIDHGSMVVAMLGVSIPAIALGPFLIWIFALKLKWFPVATWGSPSHIVLPALTLSTAYLARFARITRASMLQVVREEYILAARAKGLREIVVNLRHAFRNALIPVTTIAGPAFADIVTGSLVVEQIFAIPGIGKYYVQSIGNRDYPVIMATTLLFALVIVLMNLLVDISYAMLDPRIRYS